MTPKLDLSPVITPEAPNWWPLAWGWWCLAIAVIALTVIGRMLYKRYKQERQVQKIALAKLTENSELSPAQALATVRQAAMSYFPREAIASLQGEQWYQFLDEQLKSPRFVNHSETWQRTLYQSEQAPIDPSTRSMLVDDCIYWVRHALPPKRVQL
ncbi:DUF4381 domain-containing protein [Vibrio fortis]|uniref:DUF4381 domain-containing protein n=1 Tax=Vibrio fortis TaxID=212667 RepID=A0A5N3R120_9VIBR|nr:DUF4381 domain-containing protein [Vibrio fortis]KAB0288168.1 DUF4381 domain-containing protein [Vibrio fortis]